MHFVVASSLMHAENSAVIDWGWRFKIGRNGSRGAIAPDGQFAQFVSKAEALQGIPARAIIYVGYRFYDVPRIDDVIDAHVRRGGAVLQGDGTPW